MQLKRRDKPFSQVLYDNDDWRGKEAVADYLRQNGNKVYLPSREMYRNGDMYVTAKNGEKFRVEAEVKDVWHGDKVDWPGGMHFIKTKIDNAAILDVKVTFLCNAECDIMCFQLVDYIKAKGIVLKKSTTNSKSKQKTTGEEFYEIPRQKLMWVRKIEGKWVSIPPIKSKTEELLEGII